MHVIALSFPGHYFSIHAILIFFADRCYLPSRFLSEITNDFLERSQEKAWINRENNHPRLRFQENAE